MELHLFLLHRPYAFTAMSGAESLLRLFSPRPQRGFLRYTVSGSSMVYSGFAEVGGASPARTISPLRNSEAKFHTTVLTALRLGGIFHAKMTSLQFTMRCVRSHGPGRKPLQNALKQGRFPKNGFAAKNGPLLLRDRVETTERPNHSVWRFCWQRDSMPARGIRPVCVPTHARNVEAERCNSSTSVRYIS